MGCPVLSPGFGEAGFYCSRQAEGNLHALTLAEAYYPQR